MGRGVILVLFVLAGAAGWSLAGPSEQPARVAVAVDSRPSAPGAARSTWSPEPVVLEREPDGHFYARANVNQTQTRFLVDTGASIVALTAADASAAGLSWSDEDLVPVGKGASGTVYGVPVVLDSVELGQTEARKISGAIIPQGLPVSLLGQSFLSHVDNVRIDGDRMSLGGQD